MLASSLVKDGSSRRHTALHYCSNAESDDGDLELLRLLPKARRRLVLQGILLLVGEMWNAHRCFRIAQDLPSLDEQVFVVLQMILPYEVFGEIVDFFRSQTEELLRR